MRMFMTWAVTFNEDILNLIIYAIAAIFVVGGWVVKRLREVGAKQPGSGSASSEDSGSSSLETAAARRREELRRMAQARRGPAQAHEEMRAPSTRPSPTTNQQARARAQAEALRRAQSQHRTVAQPARRPPLGQAPQLQRRRPLAQPRPAAPPTVPPTTRPAVAQSKRQTLSVAPPLEPGCEEQVHRHVPDVATDTAETPTTPASFTRLSLRDAVVMKELLDPPVSLRQEQLF